MTDNSRIAKGANAKAPQELKPEDLEKVAGGLGGEDIGVPRNKGKGGAAVAGGTGNNLSGTDLGSGR